MNYQMVQAAYLDRTWPSVRG